VTLRSWLFWDVLRSFIPGPRDEWISLIFSLLVICAYIAFRFDPKFAVPVLPGLRSGRLEERWTILMLGVDVVNVALGSRSRAALSVFVT